MNPNPDTLFLQALDIPSGAERDAFLNEACGDNANLRRQLETMLADDSAAENFFDSGKTAPTPGGGRSFFSEKPGDVIGRFKLLEVIGEGGFGTVWMAEQSEPVTRRVALKIIRAGMDTREFIARFEHERQALAMMDHPNIARVLDGGATPGGRPYFVMELVEGVPITTFCDEKNLPLSVRLRLFVEVCRAIQHAHQKGIIHRDIKPSNILVATGDDGWPVPRVIDFGIAKAMDRKLTNDTLLTQFEQMIGTPAYMAPEQVSAGSVDIDTRSDVYSLGVLLYEILTGRPPFDPKELLKAGLDEMRRVIRQEEPPKPSTCLSGMVNAKLSGLAQRRNTQPPKLLTSVRGDLDWIVMKALEKDRARRYETANDFAADIRRHLRKEPVLARPPGTRYRAGKFAQRNKAALSVAALVTGVLISATGVSLWQANVAKAARDDVAAKADAERAARNEAEVIVNFLAELFLESDTPRYGRPANDIFDLAGKKLESHFANLPAPRAQLQAFLGEVFRILGHPVPALRFMEKAVVGHTGALGSDHPQTISAMSKLARLYQASGRRDDAIKTGEEALKLSRKVSGPKHAETVRTMAVLAECYGAWRPDDALKLWETVLAIRRETIGAQHPDTLWAIQRLSGCYFNTGRPDEAIRLKEEWLATSLKLFGADHEGTRAALSSLQRSYSESGRHDESLRLLQGELTRLRDAGGAEDPEVLEMMNTLAASFETAGRTAEAVSLREQVVEAGRRSKNADQSAVHTALSALSQTFTRTVLPSKLRPAQPGTTWSATNSGDIMLQTSLFAPAEGVDGEHEATRWQLRTRGGSFELDPAFEAESRTHLTDLHIPAGVLLPKTTYFWRAAHISRGIPSLFSAEQGFTTGDFPFTLERIDLSGVFNRDVVADPGDPENDDYVLPQQQIIVNGFDGTQSGRKDARGLPKDGRLGVHQLGDYAGKNALECSPAGETGITIPVPRGRYAALRCLISGKAGAGQLSAQFKYADGTTSTAIVARGNWFATTRGELNDERLNPVCKYIDWVIGGKFYKRNTTLFERILEVRPDAELTSVLLENSKAPEKISQARFHVFAITAVKAER